MSATATTRPPRVTATFAIPLVLANSFLSLSVVKTRIDCNTWQGDKIITKDGKETAGIKQPDGNTYDPLLIATRIHITLILAGLAELNRADRKKLTTVLAAFLVIRASHVVGLAQAMQPARAVGYFGTQFVQLGLASWLGLLTKGYWGY